ncbi:MAG: hypothetical protein K2V38_04390 [Gemmataceae bacterium]|nr:hypothetical protein [Gemmataceae bacterium]
MGCPTGNDPPELNYTTEHIEVLSSMEHIRRRPGMYLGGTDANGLHHLLFELVSSSLGAVRTAGGRGVRVTLHADNAVTITDDGVPPPNLDETFVAIYSDGRLGGDGRATWFHVTANALSEWLHVEAFDGSEVRGQTFRRGLAEPPTHATLSAPRTGLTLSFRPDPLIFGEARFDANTIRDRLRQFAYLHSGLEIAFTNESTGAHDVFTYPDGIAGYVHVLSADRKPLHPDPIVVRGEELGVRFEAGLQWCDADEEVIAAFTNGGYNPQGGTHVTGLRSALTRTVNEHIRRHWPDEVAVKGEDVRCGLTAVVSVWLEAPYYESATRWRLSNPEPESAVGVGVANFLRGYFEANPAVAEAIARKALAESDLREAARAARQEIKLARKNP